MLSSPHCPCQKQHENVPSRYVKSSSSCLPPQQHEGLCLHQSEVRSDAEITTCSPCSSCSPTIYTSCIKQGGRYSTARSKRKERCVNHERVTKFWPRCCSCSREISWCSWGACSPYCLKPQKYRRQFFLEQFPVLSFAMIQNVRPTSLG